MSGASRTAFGLAVALLLCYQAAASANATHQPEALTAEQEAAALSALAADTPASPLPGSPDAGTSMSPDPPCAPPPTANIPASLAAQLGETSRLNEGNLAVLDAAHAVTDALIAAAGSATWAACSDYTSQAIEVCQTELTDGSAGGSNGGLGSSSSLLRLRLNISCVLLTGDSLAVEALVLAPPPLADNQTMQVLHWQVLHDMHPLLGPAGDDASDGSNSISGSTSSAGSPPATGGSMEAGSPPTPAAVDSSVAAAAPAPVQQPVPGSDATALGLRCQGVLAAGAAAAVLAFVS